MKTAILAMLIAASVVPATFAQDGAVATQEKPTTSSAKPLVVFGRISADGNRLISDIDSEWSVSNKDAVKGHEGRLVRVKCYVDTEKSSMRILSVKSDESAPTYAVTHSDSAFRR